MPFQRDRTSRYVKKDAGRAPARREYLVPLLLLGINAEVIQLVLFREALMLSNGSEISLGLALASWALFNGAGALAAFPFGRGGASRRGRFFTLLILLLPLFCAGSIHLARVVRELFGVPGATPLRLLLFSGMASFVLGPVTFLDGFLFVSALDAFFTPRGRGGEGAAVAYGTESLGALAGGLIFTFFWVRFLDPISIAGLLACLNGLFLRTPDTARFLSIPGARHDTDGFLSRRGRPFHGREGAERPFGGGAMADSPARPHACGGTGHALSAPGHAPLS